MPVLTSAPTTGEWRGSGRVRCGLLPWRWLVDCDVESKFKMRRKIAVFLVRFVAEGVNGSSIYPHRKFYKVVLKGYDDVFKLQRVGVSNYMYTRSIEFAILHPAHKAISARINMSQAASKFSLSMAVQAVVN